MDTDESLAILREHFKDLDDPIAGAFRRLDTELSAAGTLPEAWERFTHTQAAAYVGMTRGQFTNARMLGKVPDPEGKDSAGRHTWSRQSLDRVRPPAESAQGA